MITQDEALYNEAKESLERIQQFDCSRLPQKEELGKKLNFEDAVIPAKELIELFNRLSVSALVDFPDAILTNIKKQADSHYKIFSQILDFSSEVENPHQVRKQKISALEGAYTTAFNALHPYIAYSLHRSADFQNLDTQARSTLQAIEDRAEKVSEKLQKHEENANSILADIRKTAEEEGVTQQAIYFKDEFEYHITKSRKWRKHTRNYAIFLEFLR